MMKKENIPLVIGLCIPVLMIIIVAISIYLPTLFAPEPIHNFIYASWHQNYASHHYYVDKGKIVREESPPPYKGYEGNLSSPKLFIYDIKNNQPKEIPLEQAQKYKLDSSKTSPDGFEITYGSYDCDPFFVGCRNHGTVYLKGHHISKKLNIEKNQNYYRRNFNFIGWIMD